MRSAPFMEDLPCKLSEEEVRQKSQQLAKTVYDLGKHQEHMKEVASGLKTEEKRFQGRLNLLAKEVTTKIEERPVECYEVAMHSQMLVEIVRADTGERVRTRPMDMQEREDSRQGKLFGYGDDEFKRETREEEKERQPH